MNASMQGRDNRNARGLATARAIERAAVDLATLHGAEAMTVDEICAAVGVSQRTFFNHFSTKDDALLGLEVPRVNEQRAREYLADPDVGILSGAIGLIELPSTLQDDPELEIARFRVLAASPGLGLRQAERMMPIFGEVAEVVQLKIKTAVPTLDPAQIRSAALTITSMAAAVLIQLGGDNPPGTPPAVGDDPIQRLESLREVWSRLL